MAQGLIRQGAVWPYGEREGREGLYKKVQIIARYLQSTLIYPELLGPWKFLPDNKFLDISHSKRSVPENSVWITRFLVKRVPDNRGLTVSLYLFL